MTRQPATVRVAIDRLVLRGFPVSARESISRDFSSALGRLLATPGTATALLQVPASERRQAVQAIRIGPGRGAIGTRAAESIVGKLRG